MWGLRWLRRRFSMISHGVIKASLLRNSAPGSRVYTTYKRSPNVHIDVASSQSARERFAGGMSCGVLNTTSIAAFFFTWINTDNLAVWLGPCIDFLTEKGVPFQRPLNQDRWWRPSLPQGPFLPHRSHHLGPADIATCIQITLTSQGQSNFSFLSIFQYWTNATDFSAELSGEGNEKNWADRPFVLYYGKSTWRFNKGMATKAKWPTEAKQEARKHRTTFHFKWLAHLSS